MLTQHKMVGADKISHRGDETKIHTNSFVRGIKFLAIKWKLQKRSIKIQQYALLFLLYFFVIQFFTRLQGFNQSPLLHHSRTIRINEAYSVSFPNEEYPLRHRKVEALSEVYVQRDQSSSPFEEEDCKAMHDWQIENHSTCNPVYEIGAMKEMQHLAEGGIRDVWWARDGDGSDVAVKTLSWGKDFNQRGKERHQRDANAYAVLQPSKHIPNIYGHCEFHFKRLVYVRLLKVMSPHKFSFETTRCEFGCFRL